jgi:hypothetical protein
MTDEERIQRGHEANRLANDPLLVEALADMERAAVDALVSAKPGEDDLRRCLAERIRVIRGFRAALETTIAVGSQAAKEAPAIY